MGAPLASLSYLVPCWNELSGLDRTIGWLDDAARSLEVDGRVVEARVLVVDDASTDGSGERLDELAARLPRLEIVHRPRNGGLGAALRTGIEAVSTEWLFYLDADLPVDPLVAARALRVADLHDADIVSCYRHDRTGEGLRRSILSAGYNVAVRGVTGLEVRDVNFAAKLVRSAVARANLPESRSLFFDAELLARALSNGARMQQIGVDYLVRSEGTSTLSSLEVVRATASELVRIGPRVRLRRRG